MALNGIDVSGWQPGINISKNGVPADFVVIKATGGVSYVSNDCDRQYQQAKAAGKLVGVYHFANDDNLNSSATAEAQFFVNNTRGYQDGQTLLVLDFEAQALKHGAVWAKAFMDEVLRLTKIKPIIYLMGSACQEEQYRIIANADYGLWIANWGANSPSGYRVPGAVSSGVWPFYMMHQYTSEGTLSGWNGRLDLNYFPGDRKTWLAYAAKDGKSPAPTPQPTPQPTLKDTNTIANEVISGAWGNGNDRKKRLEGAGYNYNTIQAAVDSKMGNAGSGPIYVVKTGDTLSGIGSKTGVNWKTIASINGISNPNLIFPGQTLKLSANSSNRSYVVKSGDTLSGIASKVGTTWQELQRINGIADANKIYAGQVIRY